MKIGNVVYEDELINHKNVDYVNYFKEKIDYKSLDNSLPTLYVGWSFMKKCNSNNSIFSNVDILEKKIISKEIYWEFAFKEMKSDHITGIENFINNVSDYYFSSKYNYINLDPLFFQLKDIEDLMDVIPNKIDNTYVYKNEMIYILYDNKITGINLNIYDFFKFNIKEIKNKIKNISNKIIEDLDGEVYTDYYKKFPLYSNLKRYMVAML